MLATPVRSTYRTLQGNNLQRLTAPNECLVGFTLYEKQGFMLMKMQRDQDGNGKFNKEDGATITYG